MNDRPKSWPEPIEPEPEVETLTEWEWNAGCEATDGCWVEPDGWCEHGYPSWMIYLGYM